MEAPITIEFNHGSTNPVVAEIDVIYPYKSDRSRSLMCIRIDGQRYMCDVNTMLEAINMAEAQGRRLEEREQR